MGRSPALLPALSLAHPVRTAFPEVLRTPWSQLQKHLTGKKGENLAVRPEHGWLTHVNLVRADDERNQGKPMGS